MLAVKGLYNDGQIVFKKKLLFEEFSGSVDRMIDVNMSYELFEAAACEKELFIVEGAGHAQAQDKAPDAYYGRISEFLGRYL